MKTLSTLKWLVHTKMGWLIISLIWFVVFIFINDNIESVWPFWVALPAMLYIVGLTLVMIAYAWVISPIREYKENKKFKEQNK